MSPAHRTTYWQRVDHAMIESAVFLETIDMHIPVYKSRDICERVFRSTCLFQNILWQRKL